MSEQYEKINIGKTVVKCALNLIALYNSVNILLNQAPRWGDTRIQRYENNEYLRGTKTTPESESYQNAERRLEERIKLFRQELSGQKFRKTIEINPTQINLFDTLMENRNHEKFYAPSSPSPNPFL